MNELKAAIEEAARAVSDEIRKGRQVLHDTPLSEMNGRLNAYTHVLNMTAARREGSPWTLT